MKSFWNTKSILTINIYNFVKCFVNIRQRWDYKVYRKVTLNIEARCALLLGKHCRYHCVSVHKCPCVCLSVCVCPLLRSQLRTSRRVFIQKFTLTQSKQNICSYVDYLWVLTCESIWDFTSFEGVNKIMMKTVVNLKKKFCSRNLITKCSILHSKYNVRTQIMRVQNEF